MANPYFRNIPDLEYVNTTSDGRSISDYVTVKNLFKKGKLREDILQESTIFEKYTIQGNDRPDNVANEVYGDPTLDWVILLSNNILNVYNEWPLDQESFDTFVTEKYLDVFEDEPVLLYSGIHHYESIEVKNTNGVVVFPKGLQVDEGQSITYYDSALGTEVYVEDISTPVTNYQYEEGINNLKRNIYILKPIYLNVVFDDLEEMMTYKKGSTQYVNGTLKRGDNIRLYQ
tara:strand:- start:10 stop:699 length:690 start_codon:yes stop_codon:yes gene_type:complete